MKEGTIVNKDQNSNAGFDDEGRPRKLAMFDAVTDASTGAAVGASGALGMIVLGTSTLGSALPLVGTALGAAAGFVVGAAWRHYHQN
jgi:hypothetical protein